MLKRTVLVCPCPRRASIALWRGGGRALTSLRGASRLPREVFLPRPLRSCRALASAPAGSPAPRPPGPCCPPSWYAGLLGGSTTTTARRWGPRHGRSASSCTLRCAAPALRSPDRAGPRTTGSTLRCRARDPCRSWHASCGIPPRSAPGRARTAHNTAPRPGRHPFLGHACARPLVCREGSRESGRRRCRTPPSPARRPAPPGSRRCHGAPGPGAR